MVRLTPDASRDAIAGMVNDAGGRPLLAIRIAAPPVEGAANAALIAFLAKTLKIRRSDIAIVAGETARVKQLLLEGDGPAIAETLNRLIGVP